MSKEDWRDRLAAVLEKSGKSKRAVSLGAGLGHGYMHGILVEGKDPSIDNLVALCRELGVSLSYVLYGVDISSETEAIIRELERASPERRKALLEFLKS